VSRVGSRERHWLNSNRSLSIWDVRDVKRLYLSGMWRRIMPIVN
jgi:hypothetical protein